MPPILSIKGELQFYPTLPLLKKPCGFLRIIDDSKDLDNGIYLSWSSGVTQLPYTLPSNLQVLTYPDISDQYYSRNGTTYQITSTGGPLGPLSGKFSQDQGGDLLDGLKPVKEVSMPATLYFAMVPNVFQPVNLTVIQCELRNSSYKVSFEFVDEFQTVDLHVSTTYNNFVTFESLNVSSGNGLVNATMMRDSKTQNHYNYG
ncbi:hypothetical protein BP5796_12422 [Coleophoma crateriformis]|uniref:Uncharacterized protein n=1 Tax=Coleophoma crateriformis TaxID=565419 RepID=A0A3D8Q9G9_9HELO|nr:hypothetical protein BP5796_12422 [Coleophoma crateriformis]